MKPAKLKNELLSRCFDYIAHRKERIQHVLNDIKESLNDEEKSTVGDKHHVTRAMLQIEQENSGRQLVEVEKLEAVLGKIDLDLATENVHLGSLVQTSQATYFISISAGEMKIDNNTIYCVSTESPIGALLLGKHPGETIEFNEKSILIKEVI